MRYGNVNCSRGSVIPAFLSQKKNGYLNVTDKKMTRFSMELKDSVKMVLWSIQKNLGGEVFIPKLPSYKILDLAKAIDEKIKIKISGIRAGEKISEELITPSESINCYDLGKYYVLLGGENNKIRNFYKNKYPKVSKNFSYNSSNNKNFLNVKQLKQIINNFINNN